MSTLLGVTVVTAFAAMLLQAGYFIRTLRLLARTHAREIQERVRRENELLDRLMHMADKTWTPPPEPIYQGEEEAETMVYHPEAMLN